MNAQKWNPKSGICPLCLFILDLDYDGHLPRCVFDCSYQITFGSPIFLKKESALKTAYVGFTRRGNTITISDETMGPVKESHRIAFENIMDKTIQHFTEIRHAVSLKWRRLDGVGGYIIEGGQEEIAYLVSKTSPILSIPEAVVHLLLEHNREDSCADRCANCQRTNPLTIEQEDQAILDPKNASTASIIYPLRDDTIPETMEPRWFLRHDWTKTLWELRTPNSAWEANLFCDPCFQDLKASGEVVCNAEGRCPRCTLFQCDVTCLACKLIYGCMGMGDTTQGVNCSSSVKFKDGSWWIFCGYGSDYDMDAFKFLGDPDEVYAGENKTGIDPICDLCIKHLIDNSIVIESKFNQH